MDHSNARENVTQKFTHLYSDVFKICADKGPEPLFTVVVKNTLPIHGPFPTESREPRFPDSQGTTGGSFAVIPPDACLWCSHTGPKSLQLTHQGIRSPLRRWIVQRRKLKLSQTKDSHHVTEQRSAVSRPKRPASVSQGALLAHKG